MQAYVEYFQTHGQEYVHMIWQHLYLSLLAVGIAAAVGSSMRHSEPACSEDKEDSDYRIQCLAYYSESGSACYSDSDHGSGGETGTGSIGDSGNPTNSDTDNAGIFTGSRFSAGSGRCHGHG